MAGLTIPQDNRVYIQYAADPGWDFSKSLPSGNEAVWIWEESFTPVGHRYGQVMVGAHRFWRIKVGSKGLWSLPIPLYGVQIQSVDLVYKSQDADFTYYELVTTFDDGTQQRSEALVKVPNFKDEEAGAQYLSDLKDVNLTSITVGDIFTFNGTKWVNEARKSGFNKEIGTTAGTIAAGNDSRFMTQLERDKLAGIEAGAEVNVQADWDVIDVNSDAYIRNKPPMFSGDYDDLTNKPTLFSGAYADLTGKPTLFSGDYNDLTNQPTLFSGSYNDLTDKPVLFSGDYDDLTDKPDLSIYVPYLNADSAVDLNTQNFTTSGVIKNPKTFVETSGSGAYNLNFNNNEEYKRTITGTSTIGIIGTAVIGDVRYLTLQGPFAITFSSVGTTFKGVSALNYVGTGNGTLIAFRCIESNVFAVTMEYL